MARTELQPAQIRIRHVFRPDLFSQTRNYDSSATILGRLYGATQTGINGPRGFTSGQYERRLNEEGTFSLRFPNSAGEDGVLHRDRFLILQKGKRTVGGSFYLYGGGTYRPGDEWIEIYRVSQGQAVGDLLFVGTPTQAKVTQSSIDITGYDGFWLLKKTRETGSGSWQIGPRDALEYYTGAWTPKVLEDFTPGPTISNATNVFSDTSDSRLRTKQANGVPAQGIVRLGPVTVSNTVGEIDTHSSKAINWGGTSASRYQNWKVDTSFYIGSLGDQVQAGLYDYTAALGHTMRINTDGTTTAIWGANTKSIVATPILAGYHSIAIEGRGGRFVYYFLDQNLVYIAPMMQGAYTAGVAIAQLTYVNGVTSTIDLDVIALRQVQPFLQRGVTTGDYRIGGAPTTGSETGVGGGLLATYYADYDIKADTNFNTFSGTMRFTPSRVPYANRVEQPAYGAANWQATGLPDNNYFTVRWTGSINLDLATNDRYVRGTVSGQDVFTLYVGKTRWGEGYAANTSTGSLRAQFGTTTGWYPIIMEFAKSAQASYPLVLEWSTNGSSWSTVPVTNLSPMGTYSTTTPVRFESHYDQFKNISQTFALQFTGIPKQLESGLFPCELATYPRVGRDTEKVIDILEATDIGVDLNAEEVCDALLADAQGVADPTGGAQITAEVFNFLEAENHLVLHQEYDNLSDISQRQLLIQRLASNLLLRGSAWEQVQAVPAGFREFLDAFPLTGALAEFAWEPGDGVRMRLTEIGVEDASPRQILGVQRPFVPDGLGRPVVAFRQRPRALGDMIREILQTQLRASRNYQTQIAISSGTPGGNAAGSIDAYTRVTLPADLSRVIAASLVVHYKNDGSSWNVEINDSVRFAVTTVGRYDVSSYIGRAATGEPKMYARLTGGTGLVGYILELQVKI